MLPNALFFYSSRSVDTGFMDAALNTLKPMANADSINMRMTEIRNVYDPAGR